ncbi:hypothetical protein HDU80_011799 [Chytriomyces hyalinus]|nr:hypothetical protein HDU80_011799 [Chytriomyces hyalinus]
MYSPPLSSVSSVFIGSSAFKREMSSSFQLSSPVDSKAYFDSMDQATFDSLVQLAAANMNMGHMGNMGMNLEQLDMPTNLDLDLGLGMDLTDAAIEQLLSPTSPLAPMGQSLLPMDLASDMELLFDPQSSLSMFRRDSCASLLSVESLDTSPFTFQHPHQEFYTEDFANLILTSPVVGHNPLTMFDQSLLSPIVTASSSHFFASAPLSPPLAMASPTTEQSTAECLNAADLAAEFTTLSPKTEFDDCDAQAPTEVAANVSPVKAPLKKRAKKVAVLSPSASSDESSEEASDFEESTRRASIHTSQPSPPATVQTHMKRSRSFSTSSSPVGSATSRIISTGPKVFRCPYDGCDKTFPRQYNLKSHMFCHSGLRPHVCEMCNSAFARKHDLQRHVRTLHATDRPFKCGDCSQSFTQSEQLRRHQIQEKQALAGALMSGESNNKRKASEMSDEE